MIPEAMLLNCQGHPHLLQISSSFLGNGIEKSSLPGCCECWSDSGKPVRPGIDEAVSKCFFPNRLVDHVPLVPLTCLTLLVYSPTALRTTPVRRALGVPAPPPVQPIYIRCLPSSPSVSPPTHRFVVSSGPLNSTSSKEPWRPRIVNAWTEEVEELPWSSTSSGGSPGVSRPPRAAMLVPGLGRSHHLESSVVQDLEPATPAPSSSIIPPQPQGTPARVPTGQAGPKDSGPGLTPLCRGACPPRLPSL
ncbi:uncharacterized protein [Ovis canadensis]|uniref:uncharacterized protein isoform X1 n=1 Tax=Ovis canadensis TaxID=37174 RepID=UPI0037510529